MSDPTSVSAGLILADLEPYIITLTGVVISCASALLVNAVQKYTGVRIDAATTTKVDNYVSDLAAREVAAASDNLAHAQINTGSPIVAELTSKVLVALPKELDQLGLSPAAVASKLTAAFGRLQSNSTIVAVTPPAQVKTETDPEAHT